MNRAKYVAIAFLICGAIQLVEYFVYKITCTHGKWQTIFGHNRKRGFSTGQEYLLSNRDIIKGNFWDDILSK